jgi:hypothetical protein
MTDTRTKSELLKENESLLKQLNDLRMKTNGINENATTTNDINVRSSHNDKTEVVQSEEVEEKYEVEEDEDEDEEEEE